ncbi:MAG: helix-turn-helix domain-containing protein [Gammaproteobacteria bacterium]|nr:helix-turn-helix domain-containing protein [Gammaproteobacteria bacterium]
MISTSDRQDAVQLIDEARAEGARLQTACAELDIGTNTYRRWGWGGQDRRPLAVRPIPRHALSPEERQQVLEICHRHEFASLPPGQIVPRLLDEEGLYVASESSYYRIEVTPSIAPQGIVQSSGGQDERRQLHQTMDREGKAAVVMDIFKGKITTACQRQ